MQVTLFTLFISLFLKMQDSHDSISKDILMTVF